MFLAVGFDSIAIALLARANPFAVVPAAILWGSMLAGAPLMQQETGLSIDIVRIVQALVLLFVAADVIVRTVFRMRTKTEGGFEEPSFGTEWGGTAIMTATTVARPRRTRAARPLPDPRGDLRDPRRDAGRVRGAQPRRRHQVVHARATPPEPAEISFSPRTLVVAIGLFYILTAVATFVVGRSAQWGRYARPA